MTPEEKAATVQFNQWLANLERIEKERREQWHQSWMETPKREPCCDKPDYEETCRCANCGAYLF